MDKSKNSIQMGYQCKNPFVCCLFIFFYIFVIRPFPLLVCEGSTSALES